MTDITIISLETLEKDLKESLEDISVCQEALKYNITSYSGGEVKERLEGNQHFVEVIEKELKRRKETMLVSCFITVYDDKGKCIYHGWDTFEAEEVLKKERQRQESLKENK